MIEIPLVNGKGVALVDDEDAPLVQQYRWSLQPPRLEGGTPYARTWVYNPARHCIAMHSLILPGVLEIDHIDGRGLNNQRSNLRPATHVQNMHNTRPYKGKRFKGVCYRGRTGNWEAYIKPPDTGQIHLGKFTSEEEAARAYDTAAIQLFGEYARLNLPHEHAPVWRQMSFDFGGEDGMPDRT